MSVEKVVLFYKDSGHGVPVVCLHGYPLDHTIWYPVEREMHAEVRFILPDLRGQGRSPAPEGPYTMCRMAEDVVRLLDKLEIERALVLGHSMGGYVGLAFAHYFSDRMLGLGLVASHVFEDTPEKKEGRRQNAEHVLKFGVESLASMAEKLTEDPILQEKMRKIMLDANPQGVAGVLQAMADRPDALDWLASPSVPVVLIAGARDQIISRDQAHAMANVLPPGHYFEIEEAGHMPMMEAPIETAEAIRAFLKMIEV